MGVFEYRGEPGLTYLYLATKHGTAPHTLQPGDLVDFGEHEPPVDKRWIEAPDGTAATKLPDNHPDNQPVVQYPEPEPEDTEPQDAKVEPEAATEAEPAPAETADTAPTKRSKPAAKTTA